MPTLATKRCCFWASSGKGPTKKYNYGQGQERFVWALISAVGIFFLGCGVTLAHGIDSLFDDHAPPHDLAWAIGVLAASFVIEGYVLIFAYRDLRKSAAGRPFLNYVRTEADPAAVAVLLEDFAACVGVLVALGAIGLTKWTGHAYWDSIGSIFIGFLLGMVAVWLTFRNKELLVGRAAPKEAREAIRRVLDEAPSVQKIVRLKSKVIDTETYDVLVELEFHGQALAEGMEQRLREAYAAGFDDFDAFFAFAKTYADEVLDELGKRVDELEKRVQEAVPEVKHIDVEPDAGDGAQFP